MKLDVNQLRYMEKVLAAFASQEAARSA